MDIPGLMMNSVPDGGDIIEQSIVSLSLNEKDKKNKELLNIWMEMNCDSSTISFVPFAYQQGHSESEFLYFGNNKAAANQIYIVRTVKDMHNYWTGRMKGILKNLLEYLDDGEVKSLLQECEYLNLINDKGLNLQKIEGMKDNISFDYDQKKFQLDEKTISAERFIQIILNLTSKQKFMLVIPVIVKGDKRIIISQTEEYRLKMRQFMQPTSDTKKKNKGKYICHICGCETADIDTISYSSKLKRESISKVFVTTPINYAPGFEKKNHYKNFSICKSCFERWSVAEKIVMKDHILTIAGEKAVLLSDGITEKLNDNDISNIYNNVDLAFHPEKYEDIVQTLIEDHYEEEDIDLFEFNLLFYKLGTGSCSVYKTIESVSSIWFENVKNAFRKVRRQHNLDRVLKQFHLGTIYHMIPVTKNEKGVQLDIHRVLDMYSCLLDEKTVFEEWFYELFADALDKGHKQIISSKLRNYRNLHNLNYYHNMCDSRMSTGLEWYIQYISYAYLGLKKVLIELDLLRDRKGDRIIMQDVSYSKDLDRFEKKEEFVAIHGFDNHAKGLFYIGAIMYQVGIMQYYQGHKNKPILEKITYGGMSDREIMVLLNELHDKIRQYRKAMESNGKGYVIYDAERYMERAYFYLGNLPQEIKKQRDEHENIFYLMSGYANSMTYEKKESNND